MSKKASVFVSAVLLLAGCDKPKPSHGDVGASGSAVEQIASTGTPSTSRSMIKSAMTQSGPDGPQTKEELAQLKKAFRAAFPDGADGVDKDGKTMTFAPIMLVPIKPSIYALVSEGTLKEEDQCSACYGALAIDYLRNDNGTYSVLSPARRKWVEGGSMGNAPMWKLTHNSAGYVMITKEDDQMEQGEEQCTLGMYLFLEDGIKLDIPGETKLKKQGDEFADCSLRT
jgi:hypothetical protein